MSTLTQALNRILKYLEAHKPEAISLLQPGLSQTEIEEIVKDLPIKISQDICDLYTWKNGSEDSPCQENTAYIFNGFSFYPLEEVICLSQSYPSSTPTKYGSTFTLVPVSNRADAVMEAC